MSAQLAVRMEETPARDEDEPVAALIELLTFSGGQLPELSSDEVAILIAALRLYEKRGSGAPRREEQEHLF